MKTNKKLKRRIIRWTKRVSVLLLTVLLMNRAYALSLNVLPVQPVISQKSANFFEEITTSVVLINQTLENLEKFTRDLKAPVKIKEVLIEEIDLSNIERIDELIQLEKENSVKLHLADETESKLIEEIQELTLFPKTGNAFLKLVKEKNLSLDSARKWAEIIRRESSWKVTAKNPTSGAYGLPQSLPAHKMLTHGEDWETNPETQLRWMYDYMNERYGSIEKALEWWDEHNWY